MALKATDEDKAAALNAFGLLAPEGRDAVMGLRRRRPNRKRGTEDENVACDDKGSRNPSPRQ